MNRIVKCFKQAEQAAARGVVVTKDHFVVDIGEFRLTPLLKRQLSEFNVRRQGQVPRRNVARLWIVTRGELVEIPMLSA